MSRLFFPLLVLLVPLPSALAQKPTTPPPGSALRKSILDALRAPVEKDVKQPVQFVVTKLSVLGDWAFFGGEVQRKGGGKIDFLKTRYAEAVRSDAFDGPSTCGLLRRKGGRWRCVTFVIGPTDVAYADWARRYGAPRAILPYNE